MDRYPYGARSEPAIFVGDLLCQEVPTLSDASGTLDIVAIARRPGVLSKVAIRPRPGSVAPLRAGIGADDLARVSQWLDGERIQVVRWQRSASAYIAGALGLGEVPPVQLQPWIGHARVLLGEIDVRGIGGWRGYNAILASALTGWRIHLEPIGSTHLWRQLSLAMASRRSVLATVVGPTARGVRLDVGGLNATLPGARTDVAAGRELLVRITRMDPDKGRIFVSDRLSANGQLPLI